MVKITYDLDNKEESKMVEDYFWFKYYMKVINEDVIKNPNIEIIDKYQNAFTDPKRTNMINRIYLVLNKDDLDKFIDLFRRVVASYFGIVYDYDMDIMMVLIDIKFYKKKKIIKFYKDKLTKYFKE